MLEAFWLEHEIRCVEEDCQTKRSRAGIFLLYFVPGWTLSVLLPLTVALMIGSMIEGISYADMPPHQKMLEALCVFSAIGCLLVPLAYALVASVLFSHLSPEQHRIRRELQVTAHQKYMDELKHELQQAKTKAQSKYQHPIEAQVDEIFRGK